MDLNAARLRRTWHVGSLSCSQAWRIVKAAAKSAGVKWGASPHWFHHSHASHAIERGVKLPVVRDTLGHASLAITNQYIHVRPDESSSEHLAMNLGAGEPTG